LLKHWDRKVLVQSSGLVEKIVIFGGVRPAAKRCETMWPHALCPTGLISCTHQIKLVADMVFHLSYYIARIISHGKGKIINRPATQPARQRDELPRLKKWREKNEPTTCREHLSYSVHIISRNISCYPTNQYCPNVTLHIQMYSLTIRQV